MCVSLGCAGVSLAGSCFSCPTFFYTSKAKPLIESRVRDYCSGRNTWMPKVEEALKIVCGEAKENANEQCIGTGCAGMTDGKCAGCSADSDDDEIAVIENELKKTCVLDEIIR